MARIDKIIQFLKEYKKTNKPGISAQKLALELAIQRCDASLELNRLFKEGVVTKTGTRPVLYQIKENIEEINTKTQACNNKNGKTPFAEIIGYDGSIKAQIELAKAAIIYPPYGLHTLILGESGVGKNLLAEEMWAYANQCWKKEEKNEIPFVQFCCADYAANEQLLLAQLFGYVKGAFTGAEEDRNGIVERAQGGILFLDEIHRLPPTGQELLFMLIDKGIYRRLGETQERRKGQLMIIGATSEDVSSSLLMTFRRRIPVQISLPRISERPIRERVNIIVHFVRQEARRLGISIFIEGKVLEIFANYHCPANIGELRNDVLLCCAKSYLEYSTASEQYLQLREKNIPQRIFSLVTRQSVLDTAVNKLFKEGILIKADSLLLQSEQDNVHDFHIDFYKYIDRKMEYYRQLGISAEEITIKARQDLEKYFSSIDQILRKTNSVDMPASIIEAPVWEIANALVNDAAECLVRSYSKNTLVALAWHLQQFKERSASGRSIYNPDLTNIKQKHSPAFKIAEKHKESMEKKLGTIIPEDELGFLTMFLIHGGEDYGQAHAGIVVVAHGRGVAQHMAELANNLLGMDRIKYYEIPLNRSNMQTVEDLRTIIKKIDEGLGVVLIVDMGFLVTMEDTLCQETGVQVRVIPNLTTALLLEAGRRLFTTNVNNLDDAVKAIYDAYDDYTMTIRQRHKYGKLANVEKVEPKVVLLVCATGQGVAKKMQEILVAEIPEVSNLQFKMASAAEDIQAMLQTTELKVNLIIGSFNPGIPDIPFVPAGELFSHDGIKKIKSILQSSQPARYELASESQAAKSIYKLLEEQLGKFIKRLPLYKVADVCKELVEKISGAFFQGAMEQDVIIRTYLHAACMFDRAYAQEALLEPQWSREIQTEREQDFKCLEKIIQESAAQLSLEVSVGEVCYFLSSFPGGKNTNLKAGQKQ